MRKVLLLFSFLAIFAGSSAQQCRLRISLLTCAPGSALYSTFGHTALRVQDAGSGADLVFNYGTFDFSPDFYVKFVRGKLLYYLSVQQMNNFLYEYQMESRSIIEQELNLTCNEKEQLYAALQWNAREENKYYLYDFLLDNCTTRAGYMVVDNADTAVVMKHIIGNQRLTFRDEIHTYLDAGHQLWSKAGIDLLLGAKIDRQVTNRESMFLPDYLMKGFDSALIRNQPLVTGRSYLLQMPSPIGDAPVFTPFLVFSALLVMVVLYSLLAGDRKVFRYFDTIFFLSLGVVGLLILFMWLGTDHRWTKNNWNIIWAFPAHLIAAFLLAKHTRLVRNYFLFTAAVNLLLIIFWWWLPQEMNMAFIPIVLLIIFRSWKIAGRYGRKGNHIPG